VSLTTSRSIRASVPTIRRRKRRKPPPDFRVSVPPPERLERLERVSPGVADRILAIVEGNARNQWANDKAERDIRIAGLLFAFLIALLLVGCASYLLAVGKIFQG
jgi:uncharacterized membrane protein